jgi:hypothetical protein
MLVRELVLGFPTAPDMPWAFADCIRQDCAEKNPTARIHPVIVVIINRIFLVPLGLRISR